MFRAIVLILLLVAPCSAAKYGKYEIIRYVRQGDREIVVVREPKSRKVTKYPKSMYYRSPTRRSSYSTYSDSYVPQRYVEPIIIENPYVRN